MAKGLDKMRPLAVILDLVVGAPHSDHMRLDLFFTFYVGLSFLDPEISSHGSYRYPLTAFFYYLFHFIYMFIEDSIDFPTWLVILVLKICWPSNILDREYH